MNILNLFKRKNKVEIPQEDKELIKMAEKILLNKMVSASNGGGSFDNVTLTKCLGVVHGQYTDSDKKYRRIKFETDDDWITGVSYEDYNIVEMYNEYLRKGKLDLY